jgi:hypothetical protein
MGIGLGCGLAGEPRSERPLHRGVRGLSDLSELIAGGFQRVGRWELDPDGWLQFIGDAPAEPGVYAIIVSGEVRYVGCAQQGVHRRFRKYGNPNNKGAVAIRLRAYITEALTSGAEVTVFAMTVAADPIRWNGLPLDLIAGLEEGLIRDKCPDWNRRGTVVMRKSAALNGARTQS